MIWFNARKKWKMIWFDLISLFFVKNDLMILNQNHFQNDLTFREKKIGCFFLMVIWTKMILNHFFNLKMILFFSIFLPDWEGCKKWKKVSKLWKNYPYWGKDEVKTGINSGKIILIGDVGLIGTFFSIFLPDFSSYFSILFFMTSFLKNDLKSLI